MYYKKTHFWKINLAVKFSIHVLHVNCDGIMPEVTKILVKNIKDNK